MQQNEFELFSPEPEVIIAGVDEVGRGPLCGPVITAAVILDPARPIKGLNDSKKLSEKKRDALFDEIKEKALAWSLGRAEVFEIDELNILHATMLAMQRAVHGLKIKPELAYIDGNRCPELPCRAEAVVKGDSRVPRNCCCFHYCESGQRSGDGRNGKTVSRLWYCRA